MSSGHESSIFGTYCYSTISPSLSGPFETKYVKKTQFLLPKMILFHITPAGNEV